MELQAADIYWSSVVQDDFAKEIKVIGSKCYLPKSSPLLSLHPIVDTIGLLWVGGRIQQVDPMTSVIPSSCPESILLQSC